MPTRKYRADLVNSIIEAVNRKNQDKLQAALDDAQKRLENPKGFLTIIVKDKRKHTLLDYTIQSGWVQGISLLLENGANPNVATNNDRGSYPLTTAIDGRHKEISIIQMLLEKGADPNVKDKTDCSPLYLASCQGSLNIVLLLIENGADLRMRNKGREKLTALRGAINAKQYRIACTLIEHLCKQKLPFSLQADQRSKLKKHASSDIQDILKFMSPVKKTNGRYVFSPEKMSDIVSVENESDLVSELKQSVSQIEVSSSKQSTSHFKAISRRRKKVGPVKPVSSSQGDVLLPFGRSPTAAKGAQTYDFVYPSPSDFKGSKKEGKKAQKDFSLEEPKTTAGQSEDSSSEDVLLPTMHQAHRHADKNTRVFSSNKTIRRTRENDQNSDQELSQTTVSQGAESSNRLKRQSRRLQPIIDQYESLGNQEQYTSPIARGAESELPESKKSLAFNRFRNDSLIDPEPVSLQKPSQTITDQDDRYSSKKTILSPIFEKPQSTFNPSKRSVAAHNQKTFSDVDSAEETPIEEINRRIAALEAQNIAPEQSSIDNNQAMSSTDESESAHEEQTHADSAEEKPIEEVNRQIAALETKDSQSTIDLANAFGQKFASPNESFLSRLEQSASAVDPATNQPACDSLEYSATKVTGSARHLRERFLRILESGKEESNNPQETGSIVLKKNEVR